MTYTVIQQKLQALMKKNYNNSIAQTWKNLYFSKTEKWSLFILSLLLLGLIFIKIWLGNLDSTTIQSFSSLEALLMEIEKTPNVDKEGKQKMIETIQSNSAQSAQRKKKKTFVLAPFDPNTAERTELLNLGIPPKVSYTIINFRKSGFEFRTKNDFSKVYGLETELFNQLSPYILLPDEQFSRSYKSQYEKFENDRLPLASIDLNSASKEELQQIRGIGNFYSSQIAEHRYRIGGFDSLEQLNEIELIPDSIWTKVKPYLKIASEFEPTERQKSLYADLVKPYQPEPRSIEINSASKEEFESIRGIGDYYSLLIVEYRERSGGFHSIEQLNEIKPIPDSILTKARPYFTVEPSNIRKKNINNMSFDSLYRHPYISYKQASVIKNYMHHHGPLKNIEDLTQTAILDTSRVVLLSKYFRTEK